MSSSSQQSQHETRSLIFHPLLHVPVTAQSNALPFSSNHENHTTYDTDLPNDPVSHSEDTPTPPPSPSIPVLQYSKHRVPLIMPVHALSVSRGDFDRAP